MSWSSTIQAASHNERRVLLVEGDAEVAVLVSEMLDQLGYDVTRAPSAAAGPGCIGKRPVDIVFSDVMMPGGMNGVELAREIQNFILVSMPEWKTRYPGVEGLNVAVMGCIVNGPGESKHADIGISLPGTGETPAAPVFVDGKKFKTLRGPTIAADFRALVIDYIDQRYGSGAKLPETTAAE